MFLSKLTLLPRSRQVLRDIASPYDLHRTIMRGFPSRDAGGPGRVLHRLEPARDGQPPVVLVQSDKAPDWSALEALDGYLLDVAVKPYQPALRPGQKLQFRLRANPTVRREGKRHGLLRPEDQLQWFHRKALQGGFQPLGVTLCRQERLVSRKKDHAGQMIQPVHLGVDFQGTLQVTDAQLFAAALAGGVGAAKGYGFGLLSVAPA